MHIMITPLGQKILISSDEDQELYAIVAPLLETFEEIASQEMQTCQDEEELNSVNDIITALYMYDLGYVFTDEFSACMLPRFSVVDENTLLIDIPDPGIVYLHGEEKAYELLDQACESGKFPSEECNSAFVVQAYDLLQNGEFEEYDEDDDDDDEDEDEEENNTPEPKEQDLKDLGIQQNGPELYKLRKCADMYKYKRIAKMFYMFKNGNTFMETDNKQYIMPDISGMSKCHVDVRYARQIDPKCL